MRCQRDVLQHGHVRVKVKGLEDHTDVGAQFNRIKMIVRDGHAVDDDVTGLNAFETIDAANQGALAAAAGSADHHNTACDNREIDVLKDMQGTKPLIHSAKLDHA